MGLPYQPINQHFFEVYLAELDRLGGSGPEGAGVDPFVDRLSPTGVHAPAFLHISKDPEAAWASIAPHALHHTNTYASWAQRKDALTPFRAVTDAELLRADGSHQVLTPEEAVRLLEAIGPRGRVRLIPLLGGLSPDLAWESLDAARERGAAGAAGIVSGSPFRPARPREPETSLGDDAPLDFACPGVYPGDVAVPVRQLEQRRPAGRLTFRHRLQPGGAEQVHQDPLAPAEGLAGEDLGHRADGWVARSLAGCLALEEAGDLRLGRDSCQFGARRRVGGVDQGDGVIERPFERRPEPDAVLDLEGGAEDVPAAVDLSDAGRVGQPDVVVHG